MVKPHRSDASATPRNQVIDGWRGVSVLLVIIGHVLAYWAPIGQLHILPGRANAAISALGEMGVSIFFAISGYLITALLVSEERRRGKISLKAFYIRRIFRIMPAFYAYMVTVLALAKLGWINVPWYSFFLSSTYTCNLVGYKCSWWLAHTWSLAVEEQFYIAWPLLFAVVPALRLRAASALFVLFLCLSVYYINALSFGYILVGVLFALSDRLPVLASRVHYGLALFAMALLALFPGVLPGATAIWVKPLLVGIGLFGTLFSPKCANLRRILSNPLLCRIGLISYSLYLWQQLSLAPYIWGGAFTGREVLHTNVGPLVSILFIPAAILSYWFLERPLVRVGHRFSRALLNENSGSARSQFVSTKIGESAGPT